jgi:hypothetical protein
MYPTELCVSFPLQKSVWYRDVAENPAYLHTMIFSTAAFVGYQRPDASREMARVYLHLGKALGYLRTQLLDERTATNDSNICNVVILTLMYSTLGDLETSQRHVEGLSRMVNMRGGLDKLSRAELLKLKVSR